MPFLPSTPGELALFPEDLAVSVTSSRKSFRVFQQHLLHLLSLLLPTYTYLW